MMKLFGCKCVQFFKKRGKCPQSQFRGYQVPCPGFDRTGGLCPQPGARDCLVEPQGMLQTSVQLHCGGKTFPLVGPEGRALNQRGLVFSFKIGWTSPCLRPITFCSYLSLLEWEYLSYTCLPWYFGSRKLIWFHRLISGE